MLRRSFNKLLSGAALAAFSGCASSDDRVPAPLAVTGGGNFGVARPQDAFSLLPPGARPESTLELFLLGGMSPWESFYAVPENGDPAKGGVHAGSQWWTFQESNGLTVPDWAAACGFADKSLLQPFGLDSAGRTVNLGPFVRPLRDRPDILKRMRIWVMRHDVEPHEVAIPLAITGHPLGNPRSAALSTHLQRWYADQATSSRATPYSYILGMNLLGKGNNGKAATAVGLQRASARPTLLQLGTGQTRLARQLTRPGTAGYRDDLDALVRHYLGRYEQRVRPSGSSLRAPAVDDLALVRNTLEQHEAFAATLPAELFALAHTDVCLPLPPPDAPVDGTDDQVTAAIQLARHLLMSAEERARYVQVLDQGIFTDPTGMGYDSHGSHIAMQGPNLTHTLGALAQIINQPGEADPSKLDLDKNLVLINTEFGRTPTPEFTPRNPTGSGTDHWPWGYVIVGFGGPLDEERSGVVGSIGANGYADDWVTPAEHRAAMLLAQGIWPFSGQSFAVGDVRGAQNELEAALLLRERVLGYPV